MNSIFENDLTIIFQNSMKKGNIGDAVYFIQIKPLVLQQGQYISTEHPKKHPWKE